MVVGTRIALTTLALTFGGAVHPALADIGQTGTASYYWQGRGTASGERFNPNALTAAHRSLPFNTKVKVTNLKNGRTVVVRINDRGPFIRSRIIDVSRAAASELGFAGRGLTQVRLTVMGADEPVLTETAATEPTRSAEAGKGRTRVAALENSTTETAPAMGTGGWTLVPAPSATPAAESAQPTP